MNPQLIAMPQQQQQQPPPPPPGPRYMPGMNTEGGDGGVWAKRIQLSNE